MSAPYGFGVSDFVAVGELAWKIYKLCKGAPESFHNISIELLSPHAVLKEAEETLFSRPLPSERKVRLKVVWGGCQTVLLDLQALVKKYQSLDTQSKRTWDRVRFANEDVADIRARLNTSAPLLTAFVSTSQFRVEEKLDQYLRDLRSGRCEGSVVSYQTVESLTADDKALWRDTRKELNEIGISVSAFEQNKQYIFQWLAHAMETGAFEEQPSDADNSGEAPERGRASSPGSQGLGELVEGSGMEHVPVQPGHHSPNSHWLPLVETVDEGKLKLPQKSPSLLSRVLVSNFTKLLMLAPRPQSHLITALRRNLPQVAMEIMNDAIAVSHLDKKLLNVALVLASKYDFPGLVDILIKSGASVHFVLGTTEVSENRVRETALLTAVDCQKLSIVKALLAHDAWLDLYESYTNVVSLAIERKFDLTAEAILRTLLFANPRSGVDNDDNFMEIVEGKHELKGSTVLHQAIRSVHVHGSSNVIAAKILLEYGVDANGRGDRDVTPLMAACYIRDMGLIALLLDWGANINEQIFYRGLIRGPPPVTVARVPLLSIDNAVAAAMCSGRSLILRYLLAGGATADWKLLLKTYTNTLLQFLHEREGDRDGLWGIRKIFEDKCSAIGRAGSSNAA